MATQRAFRPNEAYDVEQASDGHSRYGAYLAQKRGMFLDPFADTPTPTMDRLEFAATAWEIAQSPIMSPGYVSTHPRIQSAEPTWDEEHHLAITVSVAMPSQAELLPGYRWRTSTWMQDSVSGHWYDPADCGQLTVLHLAKIRVPIQADDLPQPDYQNRNPVTSVAKTAVSRICDLLNREVGTVLDGFPA